VTNLLKIVSRLEESGGSLVLDGDRIRYRVPSGNAEVLGLLNELRKHRERVRALLRQRAEEDCECRFRQPHAKLFPFLGRKVKTPAGHGTLIQVFAGRVTVLLDPERDRCRFFLPGEVQPVSWELP
jgi:hypothetical protein